MRNNWKIFLNPSKTEFTIFTKSTKMIEKMNNGIVKFENHTFKWSPVVKYLGIYLDTKLLFKNHIEKSIKKANGICFSSYYCLLNRKSPVSLDSKLRIYKSCIRPLMTYGCPVFANAAKCHINKMQLLQNKILRMILNVHWSDFKSTEEIHCMAGVPLISSFINQITENFYMRTSGHDNVLFSSLGNYDKDSLSFRVKHKLPKPLS